jgi:hypothetical protein
MQMDELMNVTVGDTSDYGAMLLMNDSSLSSDTFPYKFLKYLVVKVIRLKNTRCLGDNF